MDHLLIRWMDTFGYLHGERTLFIPGVFGEGPFNPRRMVAILDQVERMDEGY